MRRSLTRDFSFYPREFSLVPEVEECTNAIFGVKVAVILNEPEPTFQLLATFSDLTVGCGCFTLCKYY